MLHLIGLEVYLLLFVVFLVLFHSAFFFFFGLALVVYSNSKLTSETINLYDQGCTNLGKEVELVTKFCKIY